MLRNIDTIYF